MVKQLGFIVTTGLCVVQDEPLARLSQAIMLTWKTEEAFIEIWFNTMKSFGFFDLCVPTNVISMLYSHSKDYLSP